jgi:hypothetical protein
MGGRSLIAATVAVAALALPAAGAGPPDKEVAHLKRQATALKAHVRKLESENRLLARANDSALKRERALARRIAAVDPCPITRANGSKPPGSTFGAEFHGNGSLWVGLWPSNVVAWEAEPDGSVEAKFGWWRGVAGELTVAGRRLDGQAPPLRAHVPDGYGTSGFQATGIAFPTAGCWEVTGRVGSASLTFVTLVVAG